MKSIRPTLILGARPGSGNIGDAIRARCWNRGWPVAVDDCWSDDAETYVVPDRSFEEFENLVVTLGYSEPAPFDTTDDWTIWKIIQGSLILPLHCVRKFVAERVEEGGRVVVIGSYGHDHVLSNSAPYCAAKAGLAHAVRCLAWDLAPTFLLTSVHPYHVPSTPLGEDTVQGMIRERGMTREEAEAYQRKDLRLPDHLRPEEIAEYVNWILDAPEAAWVSGQVINLYGGVR